VSWRRELFTDMESAEIRLGRAQNSGDAKDEWATTFKMVRNDAPCTMTCNNCSAVITSSSGSHNLASHGRRHWRGCKGESGCRDQSAVGILYPSPCSSMRAHVAATGKPREEFCEAGGQALYEDMMKYMDQGASVGSLSSFRPCVSSVTEKDSLFISLHHLNHHHTIQQRRLKRRLWNSGSSSTI